VGTGPYKLEKWESGQRLTLTANDDYFGGRPHIDRYVFRIIPDLNAQMMELMSGNIDSMGLTPDQYEEKAADQNFVSNYTVFRYQAFAYSYLGFNLKDPRFQDKRVRQAIAYAIDKQEIIDGVLLGMGRPANGPFKSDMWENNQNVKPYPYDPQKARELLAEAGWTDSDGDGLLDKNGQPFQFTIMTNQGNKLREQTGLIIQGRLAEIGIKVNLRIVEWAAFLKEYLEKQNFEAIVMGWTIPVATDLYDVWHSSKTKPGELNFISYGNEEVDRLIDEGRFTLDQAVRKKAFDRIQEIFYDDAPCVFLYVPDTLPAISSRIVGPEVAPAGVGKNFRDWYVPLDKQRYKN
jgi:peptide/nickel transport system substrate-binding protein